MMQPYDTCQQPLNLPVRDPKIRMAYDSFLVLWKRYFESDINVTEDDLDKLTQLHDVYDVGPQIAAWAMEDAFDLDALNHEGFRIPNSWIDTLR